MCFNIVCFENVFCFEGVCDCSEGFVVDFVGSCVILDFCLVVICGDYGSCEVGVCVCEFGY